MYYAVKSGPLSKPGEKVGEWNLFTYDYTEINTYFKEDIVKYGDAYYIYMGNDEKLGVDVGKPDIDYVNKNWRPAGLPKGENDEY